MRRREYSLSDKIARYLKDVHGLKVTVEDGTVKVGSFEEKVVVASRGSLDKLAERIKAHGQ